jgi:very-short-patch-repair endonuclease
VFDLNSSLYAIAEQKFPGIVMLREHFRSLPDIIRWSSDKFYGGDIVCLRDRAPAPGWASVETIYVPEGYVEKAEAVNQVEAEAVVGAIEALVGDPLYDGMSIGVVTLRAGGQAKLIDGILLDRLGGQVINERDIRCGEPAVFQGDERDVVFVSVVSTKDPITRRIGAMTKGSDERRINVAATRARNKMVVVHAVSPDDLHADDLRRSLIQYCSNPGRVDDLAGDQFDKCESQFERDVLTRVLERGYGRVRMQHRVGDYRIDMVVEGPDGRLAIECDGDRWHGEDRWDADRSRQRILERAGWTFFRVRGSAFYRDPDGSLEALWSALDGLGIAPDLSPSPEPAASVLRAVGGPSGEDGVPMSPEAFPEIRTDV